MEFKLRPYQVSAVKDAVDFYHSGSKTGGLIVQPTGAGKSLVIANIAKELDQPILVLQPSKELLVQNYKKYVSYGLKATMCSASIGIKSVSRVTFGTPGSIKNPKILKSLKRLGVKIIIVDEAHIGGKKNNTVSSIRQELEATCLIGLTATPVVLKNTLYGSVLNMLNRTMGSIYRKIIHVTQISEMTKNGYWTPIDYRVSKTDTSMLIPNSSGSDFTLHSIAKMYDKNNIAYKVVRSIELQLSLGVKSILVFMPSIETAVALSKKIGDSVVVHSNLNKATRDQYISDFRSGRTSVCFNVNVLGVGFDYPELEAIIHARPTASINMYYQHIGRVVRTHPNKKTAYVFDLVNNYSRFGLVENIVFEKREKEGWVMSSRGVVMSGKPLQGTAPPDRVLRRIMDL